METDGCDNLRTYIFFSLSSPLFSLCRLERFEHLVPHFAKQLENMLTD